MFMFVFLFFSVLLLWSFFRLKELFQVKNGVTMSLLFLKKMPKIWVGRTTEYQRKKEDDLTLFCAWQNLLIHCYNQYQNHRNHIFHWKGKCEKPNISCFDGRYESWHKYTAKRGYIEIVCHNAYENFYKNNPSLHITCRKFLD